MKFSFPAKLLRQILLLQNGSESGFVVIMALAMVLVFSLLAMSYAIMSKVDTITQDASATSKSGFYAAEAGLNLRAKAIRDTFQGYNRPSGTSPLDFQACRDENMANNGSADFICQTTTFQGHPVFTYASELPNNPTLITIGDKEVYRGLNAQEYRYDLFSTALNRENLPTTILGMRFKSRLVPLFQFAAFYNKDLEILPGPNMTLNGPVHTNGDLYLNSDNSLTIDGQVTVSGSLYRGRKNNSSCGGTVRVDNTTTLAPLNCSGGRSEITQVNDWNGMIRLDNERLQLPPEGMLNPLAGAIYWDRADLRVVLRLDNSGNPAAIEVRNANNTVDTTRTNALLNSCNVPSTTLSNTPPNNSSNSTTNNQIQVTSAAGLAVGDALAVGTDLDSNVITNISSNTITLKRKLAHPYQSASSSSSNPLQGVVNNGATVRKSVVSTAETFYNYREGKFIRMLEVDATELMNCIQQQNLQDGGRPLNDASEGGLVWYFTVIGPNSNIDLTRPNPPADGNNYGVRIRNGQELRSTVAGAPTLLGLTIVSDQAIYVQGNYNSTNKKPAAFLGDTINVLSSNWLLDDSRSRNYNTANNQTNTNLPTTALNLNSRPAVSTTINAAFLGGTDTTGSQEGTGGQGGVYNGGFENYPRFHEDWTNQNLNYRGSFVSLNRARKVDGAWCGTGNSCNIYNAPGRNWDYDTDYNNAANLPPLTPRFVYLKQEVFSREFNQGD